MALVEPEDVEDSTSQQETVKYLRKLGAKHVP